MIETWGSIREQFETNILARVASFNNVEQKMATRRKGLLTWSQMEEYLGSVARQSALLNCIVSAVDLLKKPFSLRKGGRKVKLLNLNDFVAGSTEAGLTDSFADMVTEFVTYLMRNTSIPIEECFTDELVTEGCAEGFFVYIQNPVLDLNYDDFENLKDEARCCSSPWIMAFLMVMALNLGNVAMNMGEMIVIWDNWMRASEMDIPLPWWLPVSQAWNLDWKKMFRKCRSSPWPEMETAARIAYHDTGNIFLDYEFNEGYGDDPRLPIDDWKTLRWAIREGEKADALVKKLDHFAKQAAKKPEAFRAFLGCIEDSLVPADDTGGRSKQHARMACLKENSAQALEQFRSANNQNKEEPDAKG